MTMIIYPYDKMNMNIFKNCLSFEYKNLDVMLLLPGERFAGKFG